jgi:hypothetical protein
MKPTKNSKNTNKKTKTAAAPNQRKSKTSARQAESDSLIELVSPSIGNLRDFIKWLTLKEIVESQDNVPEHQRFAHRWTIFPYDDSIYVGVATGLSGQEILNRFPTIADLPVSQSDEALPEELQNLYFKPNLFYYGPFNQEQGNLI